MKGLNILIVQGYFAPVFKLTIQYRERGVRYYCGFRNNI